MPVGGEVVLMGNLEYVLVITHGALTLPFFPPFLTSINFINSPVNVRPFMLLKLPLFKLMGLFTL
jgi:hypothetical protein